MNGSNLLLLGFGLGFLHALDADHVMAISSLDQGKFNLKKSLRFCLNWAIGHGGVLCVTGLIFFGLGFQLPVYLQSLAEQAVGLLLIFLGSWLLWQLRKESLVITTHHHGKIQHTHWHKANQPLESNHAPVMVGMLHGLAGSAPAIALIPALSSGQLGMSYLLIFSLGVMISMLGFGLIWSLVQMRLQKVHQGLFRLLRGMVASSAIFMGCYWLVANA